MTLSMSAGCLAVSLTVVALASRFLKTLYISEGLDPGRGGLHLWRGRLGHGALHSTQGQVQGTRKLAQGHRWETPERKGFFSPPLAVS